MEENKRSVSAKRRAQSESGRAAMALIGRTGGKSKSEAKRAASQQNIAKGRAKRAELRSSRKPDISNGVLTVDDKAGPPYGNPIMP